MALGAALSRQIPHPPNFTPVAAIALFGGANFADRRAGFLVPLSAMFLSDIVLGFSSLTPVVYASFALIVSLGFWLGPRRTPGPITTGAVLGALIFFILTNLGVWGFTTLYPKTLGGLVECYVAAIPFFWNTLLSDLGYSALLFGGLSFAQKRWPSVGEAATATA
jgi:hypothetical protein